ncbi:pullulanase X25 domain-containing protein [Sabulicella rubraurantiaca]|uniref:pullulanase X25 domain-containing protein n=1 Tax=Sabulicella rubraurantiaca TaxID=2811429 RepID=UPI001A976D2A|nr:PEP-CTERM sorting domain-containing protein [Sabulicella rubraurantiaca]
MSIARGPALTFLLAIGLLSPPAVTRALSEPVSVGLAGSFQSELGCAGDFNLSCPQTQLVFDAIDKAWQRTLTIPAGNYSYVVGLNGSFTESYGLNTQPGVNIPLGLSDTQAVKFYYSDETNWITDSINSRIVVLAGSFQSELGCTGDFDPSCLRTWLQDPDGNGIYTLTVDALPAGAYSFVVAVGESFNEVYGPNGAPFGGNINFTVTNDSLPLTFEFTSATNVIRLIPNSTPETPVPEPASATLLTAGLLGIFGIRLSRKRRHRRPIGGLI